MLGWSRYGWEDASAIGVKVCVFQTVLQLTWQADGWYIHFNATRTQSPPRCCRDNRNSYASSHSPPAPCAALDRQQQPFAPAKPYIISGVTDFTLRRRQPCRLATRRATPKTLEPSCRPRLPTGGSLHFELDDTMTANEMNFLPTSPNTTLCPSGS